MKISKNITVIHRKDPGMQERKELLSFLRETNLKYRGNSALEISPKATICTKAAFCTVFSYYKQLL
jgi:hypothetical protein